MTVNSSNNFKARPPIVVVMGHVDHGKTTLLDYIRKSNVADREAGGITQSVGAYEIVHAEKKITFIDTPGHEAFSKMRSRGASAADLAILVVSAEEGVKPQTAESIHILKESKTPFIVAITKIDRPNADIEKVKNELTSHEVLLEGYGGSISYQPVSSKSGENINELLDLILLAAELEDLKYDPTEPASGFVLETRMDKRRGFEATVIIKNGTLKQGDSIVTKTGKGKVRILEDFKGAQVKNLEPSAPALIIGFEELPLVGEEFITGEKANIDLAERKGMSLVRKGPAQLPQNVESGSTLNLILKATDAGTLEALTEIVRAMASDKPIHIVNTSVGDVTDGDVKMALSTQSIVIAFRSKTDRGAKTLADANRVIIISSEIVYELIKAIEDFLTKKTDQSVIGALEILAVFNIQKLDKQVVGGKVIHGEFKNRGNFDIERAGVVVGTGRVVNLQQNKEDVKEAKEGEAGLMVGSAIPVVVGDKLIIRVGQ